MLYYSNGSETADITPENLRETLFMIFDKIGPKKKILIIPPDITRFHSQAGYITCLAWEYFRERIADILPALGTHTPMTSEEISRMFPKIPITLFREHKWRSDIVTLGYVPASFVSQVSDNIVEYHWPAQVNRMLVNNNYDLILSIGQVVPHEVAGMANFNKNIFIGTGGSEGINKSHFIGAAYGIERILGRPDSPVRKVLNYASEHFTNHLPIIYILTVVAKDETGDMKVRGLFIGDDHESFNRAAELSLKVNFTMLDQPLDKVVVYLDPGEFRSTWLGNKSIYRTRMAIADNGELIVLAPGLRSFGEDRQIDQLIRKYGYINSPEILQMTKQTSDLQANLSAAAHLIHGSSDQRFRITYCPINISEAEVKSVNYNYAPYESITKLYNPELLTEGFNTLPNGESIYYISNPALGLWATRQRFKN